MRFSQRADVAIAENVTTLALGAARDRGPVLDLTVGNPTTAGFTYPSGLLADFSSDDALVYAPDPRGLPETREAIARDEESGAIDPARLVCTASTSEAYSFILKLLCDPGDRILVPAPSYPLFDDLARLEHVGVDRYPLRYDGRWHLLASDLADAITERTRAVFVVHPNNPTGSYLKADEIEALVALGLPVVSDEVFFAYPLDGRVAQKSLLAESRVPTFVLSGLSKRVGHDPRGAVLLEAQLGVTVKVLIQRGPVSSDRHGGEPTFRYRRWRPKGPRSTRPRLAPGSAQVRPDVVDARPPVGAWPGGHGSGLVSS